MCRPLGKAVDHKPFKSISSADVKIIVDLTKPLQSEVELERDDGEIILLSVHYPWLPPLCSLCGEIGHKAALCPRVYGPENKPHKAPKAAQAKDLSKPPQAPEVHKEKASLKETKSVWKPVASHSVSSSVPSTNVNSSLALPPVTGSSPGLSQGDKESSATVSMVLVVVDHSFTPAQKTFQRKAPQKSSTLSPQTSNPFDVLQDDSLALVTSEISSKGALTEAPIAPTTGPKKKRKVHSTSLIFSRDDPPIIGEMHHNP